MFVLILVSFDFWFARYYILFLSSFYLFMLCFIEFEKAKAYLKQADAKGISLYDHLTSVLLKLNSSRPADALAEFEAISLAVKSTALTPTALKEIPPYQVDSERTKVLALVDRITELLSVVPIPREEPQDLEQKKADLLNEEPQIMQDAALLEWAGVSIGREEAYKLQCAVTSLVQKQAEKDQAIISPRFFGKIFGTNADYFIIEAKFATNPEIKLDPSLNVEAPGIGVNEFVYFVVNHPEGEFTQLPWLIPEQLQTAKLLRKFFTGDLNAPVTGYPRFPWSEASLLRAQIARISHSCSISPRGYYTLDEEGDEENPTLLRATDDELELPTALELATFEGWTHHRRYILNKFGRMTPVEKEGDDDDDNDDAGDDDESDEPPALLSSLEEDKAKPLKKMWIYRQTGKGVNSAVTASNLNWPGFVAVSKGKAWANCYVGFGHKFLSGLYTPPQPPPIQQEFKAPIDEDDEDQEDPLLEQVDPLPKPEKAEGDEGGDDSDADDSDDD